MNYIYKETVLFMPVSGAVVSDKYVVTYHHSTIRVYDHMFNLIIEKYLYERILVMRKIDNERFIVLFYGGKIVQMNYLLDPECLRVVVGDKMDVYGEMVLVYDRRKVTYFKQSEEAMEELNFNKLGLSDVCDVIYSSNFVPTILLTCRREGRLKCVVVALDSCEIVEEIDICDGLLEMLRHQRMIVFVYRHFIEIFFKGEKVRIVLHKDLRRGTNVIYHVGDLATDRFDKCKYNSCEKVNNDIALENAQIYECRNIIYLFNGDMHVYMIELDMDEKKIFGCEIRKMRIGMAFDCIGWNDCRLFLGSVSNDSVMYEMQEDGLFIEVGRLCNIGRALSLHVKKQANENREDKSRFNSNNNLITNSNFNIRDNLNFTDNFNCINESNSGEMIFGISDGSIEAKNTLDFIIEKKATKDKINKLAYSKYKPQSFRSIVLTAEEIKSLNVNAEDMNLIEAGVLGVKVCAEEENEKLDDKGDDKGIANQYTDKDPNKATWRIYSMDLKFIGNIKWEERWVVGSINVFYRSGSLVLEEEGKIIRSIDNVEKFSCSKNTLGYFRNGEFWIYSATSRTHIFMCRNMLEFGNRIANECNVLGFMSEAVEQIEPFSGGGIITNQSKLTEIDEWTFFIEKRRKLVNSSEFIASNSTKKTLTNCVNSNVDDILVEMEVFEVNNIGNTGNEINNIENTGNEVNNIGNAGNEVNNIGNTGNEVNNIKNTGNEVNNIGNTGNEINNIKNTGNEINNIGNAGNECCKFINDKSIGECTKHDINKGNNGRIDVKDKQKRYVIFRTKRQLYIYKFVENGLVKLFIDRYLQFGAGRSVCNMGDFIYLKARTPQCLFFGSGIFFHRCNYKFARGCHVGGYLYFLHKHSLIKATYDKSYTYTSGLIYKKTVSSYFPSSSNIIDMRKINNNDCCKNINSCKICRDNNYNLEKNSSEFRLSNNSAIKKNSSELIEPNDPKKISSMGQVKLNDGSEWKFVVHARDAIIVAKAEKVDFEYVPFVPMVHMTTGPNSPPVSEPINKDTTPDMRDVFMGRTLRYSIALYSTAYELISVLPLDENELVCDLKFLIGTYAVVCTAYCEGEDKLTKGRIIVYALVDIVPDPSQPFKNKKLEYISEEQLKSPCLYAEQVRGLLAVALGTKLMIYDININTGLVAVGRNEIALLTTGIYTVKNFIIVSDIFRGIRLFFLRPRQPLRLHLLAQSGPIYNLRHVQGIVNIDLNFYRNKNHTNINFSSHNFNNRNDITTNFYKGISNDEQFNYNTNSHFRATLSIVTFSRDGLINIFIYAPTHVLSGDGSRLIKQAEIHTKISPVLNTFSAQLDSATPIFLSNNILVSLRPLSTTNIFPNIIVVQNTIIQFINNSAGINPKNYLISSHLVDPSCRPVVSERILLEFLFFPPAVQDNILKILGYSYNDFMDIYKNINWLYF